LSGGVESAGYGVKVIREKMAIAVQCEYRWPICFFSLYDGRRTPLMVDINARDLRGEDPNRVKTATRTALESTLTTPTLKK